MTIVSLTNCPPKLKGDLSKWLLEINTGVYVGKLSARVRDKLWERICCYIKDGQATMVYSSDNEQGFKYLTYNTKWKPVDYDGIILMKKPQKLISSSSDSENKNNKNTGLQHGFSKAYKYNVVKHSRQKKSDIYVILSIKNIENIKNTEIALIKIADKVETGNFSVCTDLADWNQNISEYLNNIKNFIGDSVVYGYNIRENLSFLRNLFQQNSDELVITKRIDVMSMAKKKIFDLDDFDINTVSNYFSLNNLNVDISAISAIEECRLTQKIILKLNEI